MYTNIDFGFVPVDVAHDPDAPCVAGLVSRHEGQSRRLLSQQIKTKPTSRSRKFE